MSDEKDVFIEIIPPAVVDDEETPPDAAELARRKDSIRYNRENLPYLVGKGWHPLVKPLIDAVASVEGEIFQIKEKFGSLRFYYSVPRKFFAEIDALVCKAEAESTKVCEECGKPGKLGGKYWLKTYCPDCRNEGERNEEKI